MAKATKKTHYLTQDIEQSTSTSKPKKMKTCHRQSCSKCSKKIRTPKVQKPKKKSKKTLPSMPKRKTSKKTTTPEKSTNLRHLKKVPMKARGKNYSVTTNLC